MSPEDARVAVAVWSDSTDSKPSTCVQAAFVHQKQQPPMVIASTVMSFAFWVGRAAVDQLTDSFSSACGTDHALSAASLCNLGSPRKGLSPPRPLTISASRGAAALLCQ